MDIDMKHFSMENNFLTKTNIIEIFIKNEQLS